ncbi:sirohydrochlorin chelatase [Kocuria sp. ZOR0020]|uniref:sirohydrochlorin chelatase n=1 Tax=Kocuria sp. ZOR0020 TaxID=1339234 RepID=UPI00068D2A4F|nr:CbiX/SirB N-terminal domain-containing protein [Kocuria sp. ZOR0020]
MSSSSPSEANTSPAETTAVPGVAATAAAEPVLLLCAHGSRAASAQTATQEIAAAVSHALPDTDVVLTWVDVQQPDVVARCEEFAERAVVIVPLLLAAGFHVHQDLAQAVADRDHHVVTGALGPDRGLSELMARRIAEAETPTEAEAGSDATSGVVAADPEQQPTLVLIAAGSSDDRAVRDIHSQAADLAEVTGREVRTGFVSAVQPEAQQAVAQAWHDGAHHVTAVSFHVAPGVFHADAARAARQTVIGAPSQHARSGGRITEPLLVDGRQVPPELVAVVVKRWEEGQAALAAELAETSEKAQNLDADWS